MSKTGAEHLASLQDGRAVYLDGRRIDDPIDHPAYRNAVRSAAALYDFQAAAENLERMTFAAPDSGARVNRCWQLPRCHAELVDRRRALADWSATNFGFLGRSPDHVASCLAGMYMGLEVFERHDSKRAAALADYFAYARDNDLYLSYVIINPLADRSKSAAGQQDEFLTAGVCDEDAQGITIKGAKMLGTSVIMSNELFISSIQPLQPGDERYAFTACIPINQTGLKVLSRKSYEAAANSEFDYPLSTHFDENDALIYFDEVKIPWERVFVVNDIEMCQRQFHETPAHVLQNYQCQVRLMVKLQFMAGLAREIAEANGVAGFPQVRESLGEIAAQASMVEAMVAGMEAAGEYFGPYFVPNKPMLYAAQVLTQELYPRLITAIRGLAGGGVIMLPSSVEDFADAELAGLIEKTQMSPATDAKGRVKLFKLAWDALGSEFASRHVQYEMFYAGASFVTKGHALRTYDWDRATGLVKDLLARYDLPE